MVTLAQVNFFILTDTFNMCHPSYESMSCSRASRLCYSDADDSLWSLREAAISYHSRIFHITYRGLIRPGMRADLVLVDGDPTQDILATRNIVAVWKRGIQVQR